MPRPVSDEELQLKKRARRRLVGAVALVVLVAIFLPMFLEREPKPLGQDIDIQIPAQDKGQFTSKIIPVPEKAVPSAPVAPAETDVEKTPAVETKTVTPEARKIEVAAVSRVKVEVPVEKVEKPKVEAKPVAKSGKETFMIPLAAFTNPANARHLQDKLKAAGIKSYTEILKTNEGDKTRVRAGPFPSREAAEHAREKLKAQGLNGNVGIIK